MSVERVEWLPERAKIDESLRERVADDYRRLAETPPGGPLHEWVAEAYAIDLATEYAGTPLCNPWGKASGQLSMTARQVAEDVEAGLGFVVLKTVIAEAADGSQSMSDWAVPEARMLAEPIIGRSGQAGWTVSWRGRGWSASFEDYLALVREARQVAAGSPTLVVPSVKYHLPQPGESQWLIGEYSHTTGRLLEAWGVGDESPMPLEKDFSPTLAGSDRAQVEQTILDWITTVPQLLKGSVPEGRVRLGMKLFNALFDDEFQLEMLRQLHVARTPGNSDWLIYGNRLFDPDREFDGQAGIAYGGPDLSDRNLRVLGRFGQDHADDLLPLSATGNIATGRMAIEYALRGASTFQLHTFFQLPSGEYTRTTGSKTEKALHELYLHPEQGLVVWMHHVAAVRGLDREPLRFADVIGLGPL